MQRRLPKGLLVLLLVLLLNAGLAPRAKADAVHDFIVSCSYGVLAGTLVGAATLAFSDKPGDNLNKVARGASLGLYAGILLGAYVVYGGSPGEDEDAQTQLNNVGFIPHLVPSLAPAFAPGLMPSMPALSRPLRTLPDLPRVLFMPVVGERGFEGARAQALVLSF